MQPSSPWHRLAATLHHPRVAFLTGVAVAGSSLVELLRASDSLAAQIHSEHGMLLFGLVQIVRSLAEILEGSRHATHHAAGHSG
jgi:hypothetical protein